MARRADQVETANRVLPDVPHRTIEAYCAAGGGGGLSAARQLGARRVIDEVSAAGLRGRGGAGFPTGAKWQTVAGLASGATPATVVVNGAEGEPGTFKDRAIMRANPYGVIEGGLIAAHAVGADRVVVAVKESFGPERAALERAIDEMRGDEWAGPIRVQVAVGPDAYLFGEETGLLEVLDGRPPFPRIAPPFRQGVDEVGARPEEPAGAQMARPGPGGAAPTLVNNVETLANVPQLLAAGAGWFRSVGTEASPGTLVCTVSGATRRAGVAELPMGTPLAAAIDQIGGGLESGSRVAAVLSGVANPLLPGQLLDTPLTYEDFERAGAGLGAAGFLVFDEHTDLAAVVAGVSRFLAVESCGQCTPCKQDGLAIAAILERICSGAGEELDLVELGERAASVSDEARCALAGQHERVVASLLQLFPGALRAHLAEGSTSVRPEPIVPIRELTDDGRAELDLSQLDKQPDWSFGEDSGQSPVERLATREG